MAPKFVKCSVPQVSQDRPGLFCSSIPHQKIMSSRIEAGSHILFQDSFFPLIQIGVPRQGPINWHSCNLQIRTVVNTNVTTESKRLVAGSCYGKWGCVLLSHRESYAQVFLPKYLCVFFVGDGLPPLGVFVCWRYQRVAKHQAAMEGYCTQQRLFLHRKLQLHIPAHRVRKRNMTFWKNRILTYCFVACSAAFVYICCTI